MCNLQVAAPTKEDIYRANKKGTVSSKKKKQKKLKRVMATVKRQVRRSVRSCPIWSDSASEQFRITQLCILPHSHVRPGQALDGSHFESIARCAMSTAVLSNA